MILDIERQTLVKLPKKFVESFERAIKRQGLVKSLISSLTTHSDSQAQNQGCVPSAFKDDQQAKSTPLLQIGSVLVLEDNLDMQDYYRDLLSPHSAQIDIDNSEKKAYGRLLSGKTYHLILVDLMIGEKEEGLVFLRNLRKQKLASFAKIIVISGAVNRDSIKDVSHLQVDGIVTKPFGPDELLDRIHRLFE